MAPHFQLRIKTLKFISAVDRGAQGPISNVALIKRAPGQRGVAQAALGLTDGGLIGRDIDAVCKVAGLDEKLGLVFGWALASTLDGGATPHVDLQNDAIIGGDELIKVAAEFMEASAASDVLHSEDPDGKIVFAMPLTKEVKAALRIQSDVEGLAIAMKPSPETFKRFVSKELNAFSIGGTGERVLVGKTLPVATPTTAAKAKKKKAKAKSPVAGGDMAGAMAGDSYKRGIGKRAVFTSEVDGHVHSIDLDDPGCCYYSMLSTSYQTAEGADDGHSHPWIYDTATGLVTIGADSGHTHTVADAVPADVLAAAAAKDEEPEPAVCTPEPCAPAPCEDKPSGATIAVVVAARAPQVTPGADSTHSSAAPTVINKENGMPTEHELQIAKQESQLSALRKMLAASLALTEPMRLHVAKLAPTSVEEFLSLDAAGRDAAVKSAEAADPEVHKTADGIVIRKSDGPVALALAKAHDASAAILKTQTEELALAKAAGETAALEKRAGVELSGFAKSTRARGLILKGIDTTPGYTDEERKEATEAIKGANFALAKLGKSIGAVPADGGPVADDPAAKLDTLAKEYAKANFPGEAPTASFAKAYSAVLTTPEGSALYNQLSTPAALRAV